MKVYNANTACYVILFECVMLTYMQISYFKSQDFGCMSKASYLYFWLMLEILGLYIGSIVVVMYVFRKLFRPSDEDDYDDIRNQ